MYLYIKDPIESKYWLLINGRENIEIKCENYPQVFTNYLQAIHDICEILEDYNPTKKIKMLIDFDDMAADMETN